ncbi:iron ABC transporter permease [Clostridium sp. NSJ-6]|uniref:Iron ABC transporter permease n=1 Tax=Clostridium hominis TaxID=2763036 RepID=A0ABR7DA99_9CLOT|nr:iron ABC transporter permease [Clostridium hominis]MBC5628321.1 iron ABC transporter permease [Clostridium hominis]
MIKKHLKLYHSIILFILIILSLFIGRYKIDLIELLNDGLLSRDFTIFFNIRLPRVILVVFSGGALALAGLVFQSIFQNPLISPDVLGVTSGCSLGAALAIIFMAANPIMMQFMAFSTGMIAVVFSVLLSKNMGGNKILGLVISGIVTQALASAMIMILKYFADPYKELPAIDYWLMGGFHNSNWDNIIYVIPPVIISIVLLYLLRWRLKVCTMGDVQATLLGVDIKKIRIITILISTLLVSVVVSVAGVVSWIGILAPHIVKSYAKDDISQNMILTVLMGGMIMLVGDTAARSLTTTEIPISILTSLVGAPFLVYLISRRGDLNKR